LPVSIIDFTFCLSREMTGSRLVIGSIGERGKRPKILSPSRSGARGRDP
jgi:hypothetical protein